MTYPQNDGEFEDKTITAVDGDAKNGWDMRFGSMGFFCPADSPVVPTVGMTARLYGKGFGYTVRGLFLDGSKVFYRTVAEEEAHHQKQNEERDQQRRYDFEKNRASFDERFAKLPACFQERIAKFRNANPDFRWEFEDYELFCCEQAVVIADALKTSDAVRAFKDLPSAEQQAQVPLLSDGHSGNTFGCAVMLACCYLENKGNYILGSPLINP